MKSLVSAAVFDLGGVLVDWNPRYLYRKLFGGDEVRMEWFLSHVCSSEWNEKNDGGVSLEENSRELIVRFPEYEPLIRAYSDRFQEMFGPSFEGSTQVLRELHERGCGLYALTNWPAEKFPWARKTFPFLSWFSGIVVSGEVKMRKPNPAIYHYLCKTYSLKAKETVFVDDRVENIRAAEELGFPAIHFRNAAQLRAELVGLGLLVR